MEPLEGYHQLVNQAKDVVPVAVGTAISLVDVSYVHNIIMTPRNESNASETPANIDRAS